MSKNPSVSVVITGLNEQHNIKQCIHSILFDQSYVNREVTYVDGGSSDETLKIVEDLKKSAPRNLCKIDIAEDKGSTPSKARNTGIARSKGDLVAFLDADCVAPSDWIENIVKEFARNGDDTGGIGGLYTLPEKASKKTFIIFRALNTLLGGNILTVQFAQGASGTRVVESLPAGNSAFTRETLERVNGFNPNLRYCEDHDLCRRIAVETKKKIIFDPKLHVVHYSQVSGFKSLLRLMYNYGTGRVDAYFIERKLFSAARMLPAASILIVLSLILAGVFNPVFLSVALYPSLAYAAAALLGSIYLAVERKDAGYMMAFFVYPITHLSYGIGTIASLIKNIALYVKRKLLKMTRES